MRTIRMLIVEDDVPLQAVLKTAYRDKFMAQGFDSVTIEEARSAEEARALAKGAAAHPYDLVSLDVFLGNTSLTGLDVLSTLRRFHSAWMVALLTGVETDPAVDNTMGRDAGASLRKRLRRDAYARFPAERLLVVEKPASSMTAAAASELLANRLEQIALVYMEVQRLRYVFRPIEVVSLVRVKTKKGERSAKKFIETAVTQWQVRFDCGDIRTLPDKTGFRTLHRLLSMEPTESLTPEAALEAEPAARKSDVTPAAPDSDPVAAFFQAKGIGWTQLDAPAREQLIRAALSTQFARYQTLRALRDDDDLSPNEEDELAGIIRELGPLADAAEVAYLRMNSAEEVAAPADVFSAGEMAQNDLHVGGGNYDRLGEGRRGWDSPEAMAFRARMKRVKDCLRENGFADFASHLDGCLQSTGANWSYHPTDNVEWTTTPFWAG